MCMFPKNRDPNLMIRQFYISLLCMVMKCFGFKLWDPTKKKLVRSRDVVFQEDQTLGDCDKTNQSKGTSDDFIQLVPILLSLKQPRNVIACLAGVP